jgi:hypothetical protein
MKTIFFHPSLLLLFLDPGSGIRDPISGIRDPGSVIRDPGSGIRDPGSGMSKNQDPGSVEAVEEPALLIGDVAQLKRPLRTGEPGARVRGPVRWKLDRPVVRRRGVLVLCLHAACSKYWSPYVETRNNASTQGRLDYN